MDTKDKYNFEDFIDIVKALRAPNGCKWDRAQTHESLRSCLIEECYEVLEAINNNDVENLREELGDVLLQVVMHSEISSEADEFNIYDAIDEVSKKLIRRHPHVFGNDLDAPNNWEDIKKQEKKKETLVLSAVPKAFPAEIRAQKVLKKAEKEYGYGKSLEETISSLENEISSIKNAFFEGLEKDFDKEIENILLDSVNLARLLGKNSENSLTNAIEKFITKVEGNQE
ncbi:MAG: MazG family protein [Lachnospiraceae bacterium]|nr:MazG family protein [Lachnospiraceae bacterium]